MSRRPTRALALTGAACLVLAACTSTDQNGGDESPSPTVDPGPERGTVAEPTEPVTVLPGTDGALALAASQAFFAAAPVVVVADDADPAAQLRASSAGLALGAPVLLDDDGAALTEELARLDAGWVLTAGEVTVGLDGTDVVAVAAPDDDDALADVLGLPAGEPAEVDADQAVATVAGLERGSFTPLAGTTADAGAGADTRDDAATTDGAEGEGADDSATTDGAEGEGADDVATTGGAGSGAGGADDAGTTTTGPDEGAGAGAEDTTTSAGDAELPPSELPEPVTGTLALSTGAPQELLATATAMAAGADVVVVPGGDPRATSESVTAMSEAGAERVVGLGDEVGDAETLAWRAETAATGVELPGGGQLVFPGKRYVALYGTPSTTALGVLGEQGVDETIVRAQDHARPYEDLTEDTVVPALEVIATVAAAQAGGDGNYSNELSPESLRPIVEAAGEAGQYVVLDLQPGRSSFLEQAQLYAELLELPHVGLALDPEWNLGPDEVHMVRIGTVTADEVNEVVEWLADFTRERNLPQKMLVLHQFQVRMIETVPEVDQSRSEVAVLVHADGQGGQGAKQDTWRTLHEHAPDIRWWGWKNFYDEDLPMLTPEQTVEQVDPVPHFISYQ